MSDYNAVHDYKLYLLDRAGGKTRDVTEVITEIKWNTERTESPGSLDFTLLKFPGVTNIGFYEGDAVQLFIDGVVRFYGYVFSKDKNEKEEIKVRAYDQLRYLKAKQSYNFSGMTATAIIKKIAADFKLVTGSLVDTKYKIPSLVMDDKSCFDTITKALEMTAVENKIVYVFYDDAGKLTLKAAGDMQSKYILGDDSLVSGYNYKTSIDDDVYNYVKLVRPNSDTGKGDVYVASASNLIKEWGFLQYYQRVDEGYTPAQIKELCQNMLKYYAQKRRTLKLSCLGVPDIRAGNIVLLSIAGLGDIDLSMKLLVESASHRITANEYTMDLQFTVYLASDTRFTVQQSSGSEYAAVEKKEDTGTASTVADLISGGTLQPAKTTGSAGQKKDTGGGLAVTTPAQPVPGYKYYWPHHPKGRISSVFGKKGSLWKAGWHTGVDYVGSNKRIYAISRGTVTRTVRGDKSYGNYVRIQHPDGYISQYAHLSRIDVFVGQGVTVNTQIGVEGSTGNSTSSHLHLELHKGAYRYPPNPRIDPNAFIQASLK